MQVIVRIKITNSVYDTARLYLVAKTPVCVAPHEYIPYASLLALVPPCNIKVTHLGWVYGYGHFK